MFEPEAYSIDEDTTCTTNVCAVIVPVVVMLPVVVREPDITVDPDTNNEPDTLGAATFKVYPDPVADPVIKLPPKTKLPYSAVEMVEELPIIVVFEPLPIVPCVPLYPAITTSFVFPFADARVS